MHFDYKQFKCRKEDNIKFIKSKLSSRYWPDLINYLAVWADALVIYKQPRLSQRASKAVGVSIEYIFMIMNDNILFSSNNKYLFLF